MNVQRIAVVFDNRPRPETTGTYVRRALGELLREGRLQVVDHFLPTELPLVPPERYDLYLYVDDGLTREFSERHRPVAWWAIDTHLAGEEYVDLAHDADFVFTAQRNGAAWFRERGIAAEWLPLAADPAIHERLDVPKQYDFAFVGHVVSRPRTELIARLGEEFPNHLVDRRYFEEMARVYSAARIVFNRSVRDDVNMRVFEALACGSLLVTNDLSANGQAELFRDDEHLVTYDDADDLIEKVRWYLEHDEEREQIAAAGRAEVLARHTYRHRVESLLEVVEARHPGEGSRPLGQGRPAGRGAPSAEGVPGFPLDQSSTYYGFARPEVVDLVPESAQRVLDVGCGAGRLGEAIKRRQPAEVVGIEFVPAAAEDAWTRLDEVVLGDVELAEIAFEPGSFDCVVCADVLEHLRDPAKVLRRIREWLAPGGVLVTSLPNVRHHSVVRSLLAGNWTYESAGLLDETHLRFFTRREIEKLFLRTGFEPREWRMVPGPGHAEWVQNGRGREVSVGGLTFRGRTPADAEEFFAYQYLTVSQPAARRSDGLTSIVIVTHGQWPLTHACLDSIRRSTDEPYELIVVDNASPDETVARLRAADDVRLIENAENRGFPAAVNQGVDAALGDRVLLLNNDTVVTTGWLRRMLDAMDSDPTIGLVGPVSNEVSGSQRIEAGYEGLAELDGFAWDWGREHTGEVVDLDRLVGFCLLVDRTVIETVGEDGLFDERFGVGNYEDDDLCRRAREAGFRTVVARDAFVHHVGGGTFRTSDVDYAALLAENERLFREKWGDESPTDRPTLSVCMIVRDNETTIRPALESIRPWVDEMIVVDTGSTDRTPDICRELGAKVHEFPWCDDFSAARNESFRHATGEWLFWMDSDDTIDAVNGRGLRDLAHGPHDDDVLGYVVQVHCPGDDPHNVTAVDHVKLVRNRPDLRFEHRIHEQLLPAIRRAGGDVRFTDLFVVHSGSDRTPEGRAGKVERDLRILELDLAERPDHPFVLFNLGMTYADVDRHDEAAEYLRRSIAVAGPHESHVAKAHALLVGALSGARRFDEAWDACAEALERYPDDVELWFRSGVLHQHFGRLVAAERSYRAAMAAAGERRFASVDLGLTGIKARHNLALVYAEMGRHGDAADEWRAILDERDDYDAAWQGLLEARLAETDPESAAEVVAEMTGRASSVAVAISEALLAEADGRVAAAIGFLEPFDDDDEALSVLCRLAFEQDDARVEAWLRRLVDRHPDDGAAWHNLGAVLLRAGRSRDAERALDRSLRVRPVSPATRALLERVRPERTAHGHQCTNDRKEPEDVPAAV